MADIELTEIDTLIPWTEADESRPGVELAEIPAEFSERGKRVLAANVKLRSLWDETGDRFPSDSERAYSIAYHAGAFGLSVEDAAWLLSEFYRRPGKKSLHRSKLEKTLRAWAKGHEEAAREEQGHAPPINRGADASGGAGAGRQDTYTGSTRPGATVREPTAEPDATVAQESVAPFAIVTPPDSFITRYIEYVQRRTDAPAAAHELMAVGMLSALAGPTPRLPIATSVHGWRLIIWAMYIVNSTTGRKTIVVDAAKDILAGVLGPAALIEWEGSPQGLIQRLQTRDGQAAVFCRDEYSGLLKQINRGGHLAGLEQTFIRAFDGGRIENIRTRKRGGDGAVREDTDCVENPYLAKLTAATWDSFTTAATIDNVLDGFLARFIFVTGAAVPQPLRLASSPLSAERDHIIEHARRFHVRASEHMEVDVCEAVLADAWDLEHAWQEQATQTCRPDAVGPSLKRLADTVLKVAALLALDDGDTDPPRVERQHFETARRMADRWRVSTIQVLEALGRSEFARHAEAVFGSVRQQPEGMSLSTLYRRHRNLRKREFDEVLAALEAQERIVRLERPSPGGRPAVIFKMGRPT